MKAGNWITAVGLVVVASFLLVCIGCAGVVQIPFLLAFGWIIFLWTTIPQMGVEPVAYAVAGGSLIAFTVLGHSFARWLYAQLQTDGSPRQAWRVRWTLSGVGLILATSLAGIVLLVTVHQVGWMVTYGEPLLMSSGREAIGRAVSSNNLKQIGLGLHNYHDDHQVLPPGGTFSEEGQAMHSWASHLLPYIEQAPLHAQIDFSLPWRHPDNAAHFRHALDVFRNWAFREQEPANPEGFAASHYAANIHVLGGNSRQNLEAVKDGTRNTIAVGEVCENFKPWGDPTNWRDPSLGLHMSPDSFGGPPKTGVTQFLMLDGSVQPLSGQVDLQVLRSLATPNGGETIREPWSE